MAMQQGYFQVNLSVWFRPVVLGEDVEISPFCYIGKPMVASSIRRNPDQEGDTTLILDKTHIGHAVTIYRGVKIGKNCLIGDGARIGGNTVIDDNVLIAQNCTIHRNSQIGYGTKVMDLTHITGNAVIGRECFIGMGVIMANDNAMGRSDDPADMVGPRIGNRVRIGMGAKIFPNVTIGDDAVIGAHSLVTKNVPANASVRGIPAKRVE